MVNSRAGTYTPSPAQTIITGVSHSPHGSFHSTLSAGASPSTNSPTGLNGLAKIAVAQIYLLLSTLKEDDRTKWEQGAEQLRKLIDENGMEVFQKYFIRLVVSNAPRIFPSSNHRPANSNQASNYELLAGELQQVAMDMNKAGQIATSIETANEELFRDFDLSTFMEHFKLDALEKTILALAFKSGSRSDLKTKADAILSANYRPFLETLAYNNRGHEHFSTQFEALVLDRFIQGAPPSFDQQAKMDLHRAITHQFQIAAHTGAEQEVPAEILSALYLLNILRDEHPLALAIQKAGSAFTADEEICKKHLDNVRIQLTEDQVAVAVLYTAISRAGFSPSVLVSTIRKQVSRDFNWELVVAKFDQPNLRITADQFLSLYEALRPLAIDGIFDIQQLWGGDWHNSETQLSFIGAFCSLQPEQLDATTIPGLKTTFALDDLAGADPQILEIASEVVKSTLMSEEAVAAIFHVALDSPVLSETSEAKRLFQRVVLPNMHTFLVSAFGVPKPWSDVVIETMENLFNRFLFGQDEHSDFVLETLWRKEKQWVASRLVDAHAKNPIVLETMLAVVVQHNWLDELLVMSNGFGLDLAALAHSRGLVDLQKWSRNNMAQGPELAESLLTFLHIKAQHELEYQRAEEDQSMHSVMLPVKTIAALLDILDSVVQEEPTQQLIQVQRACITAYPRLINYGGEFDDIIDANGLAANSLPVEANLKMEEHYKRMYSVEVPVREVVEHLDRYKHSRDPFDQDIFACMIHGLFDEYTLYGTYPLEALATTAVLFGGIISHKLISELPLEIGLGMIIEAVRDSLPETSMYKFGLQALLQLQPRLAEWPGYCKDLLRIPGLRNTEVWDAAEKVRQEHDARNGPRHDLMNGGGGITNGNIDEMVAAEPVAPPFASLNVEQPATGISEQPSDTTQEKVLFVLNNITGENLEDKFSQLSAAVEDRHLQWFAELIVEERAKMQPNYHKLYLDLLRLFGKRELWTEIIRETYVSVIRMLNSEATMQSAAERTYLKNLGGWLGSLTLARDKPIKHKNIAFKELLLEAFDTQRLIIVIPFVCKVLVQGQLSGIFKPPNPWLMDILRLLMELYHHGELKLNLKFEIEVLCKDLKLDYKTIEPSSEIMSRVPLIEEATEPMVPEIMDRFDNLSLNGLGGGVGSGRFSPQEITTSLPDLGPLLVYPPGNDMISQARLQEIVRTAITRAVHEIISPVVERSVTIAAISTAQMIHKDFAIEPDEQRIRSAAIRMVKKTAGSLALVTSKEPLRASMTNYIRTLAMDQLSQGLPEGTIIMCVNSNLELACNQVETKAEERAVPEIEDMLETEIEMRRHHQQTRPESAYQDPMLNRWALTIPHPYKLQPNHDGLNSAQLAIYEEFARQPRVPSLAGTTHVGTASDATRSIANDILQDQYTPVPSLPTPAETPAVPTHQPAYQPSGPVMANGRVPTASLIDQVSKLLMELNELASESPEQHYKDLPRQHPLLNHLDSLHNYIIKTSQTLEGYDLHIVDMICTMLFGGNVGQLVIESLVHVLENTCRIGGRSASRIAFLVDDQQPEAWLNIPLVVALIDADMVEWHRIDSITSKAIMQKKEGSLAFLSALIDSVLLNDRPVALYTDLAKSLEVAWQQIDEEPTGEVGLELKEKLTSTGLAQPLRIGDEALTKQQDQMEYVFESWIHLCNNSNASERAATHFISQIFNMQIINDREDLCMFMRLAIELSVDRFDAFVSHSGVNNEAYLPVDHLAKLVTLLVLRPEVEGEVKHDKAAHLKLVLSVVALVLNYHHVKRGEHFNQRVFARFYSTMLSEVGVVVKDWPLSERAPVLLAFADSLLNLRPSYFPGFVFGWLSLISHRFFLPTLLELPDEIGWGPFSKILGSLITYVGELLKGQTHSPMTRAISDATTKLFLVLQHDFPDFLIAYHSMFISELPSHCTYLINFVLTANPAKNSKVPDPLQPGMKIDRIDEIRESPNAKTDIEKPLEQSGLIDTLNHVLENGSTENALAMFTHEIQKKALDSGFGLVPINVDLKLVNSIVVFIGMHAVAKATNSGGPNFVQDASSAKFLSALLKELRPEARYYMISSIVNQLRFPNSETHFFCQALLDIWGVDSSDNEESDIREQITRVLLERLLTHWPQPWGVIVTSLELIKNETYGFFDMAFIKANPEVGQRFAALVAREPM